MTLSQDALAVLALTNRLIETSAAPLKAPEFWRLMARMEHPADLLGLDESAVAQAVEGSDLAPERIVRLLDTGIGLAVRVEGLYERGMSVLTAADERYPPRLHERLGSAAPPVLYCAGDTSQLASDGIGIVGSREVGPDASDVAATVAHQVAHGDLVLVSGGARGVDSIAMAAAYGAGGKAIGILADSLERAIGRRENRAAVRDARALFCTPYRPDAGFSAGNAMGRNKIIYGLSRVTLVVTSAAGEGGTWAGATEALHRGFGCVAVWTGVGAGPGNAALVEAGGVPVEQPEQILDIPGDPPARTEGQLTLALDPARQFRRARSR